MWIWKRVSMRGALQLSPWRILIVDDNPALLRLLRVIFTTGGFLVETALDGVEALRLLDDSHFQLIILDLEMPRMDGRTFYREIRARGFDTPVVLVSAYGATEAQRELGAEKAMNKPFDPEVLMAEVEGLISVRSRTDEPCGA
jgi:DNA-binding response OmpR family regulator